MEKNAFLKSTHTYTLAPGHHLEETDGKLPVAVASYPAFLLDTQWAPASALLVPVQLPTNSEAAITNKSVRTWKEWSQLGP